MARRAVREVEEGEDDSSLVDRIVSFWDDPYGFVMFIFPWGQEGTELADEEGPDKWQREMLEDLGRAVRERAVPNNELGAYLDATSSGHGVGKTTLVAWIIIWFMSTRRDCVVRVTANTATQLEETSWRELSIWHARALNASWFQWNAKTFYMKGRPATWRASAVPWSLEKRDAFAGKHAEHMLMIFDEASSIASEIWETADGAMTTPGAIWLVFGNPTKPEGRFRQCWTKFAHRWHTRRVDAREAKRVNQAQIQNWKEDWGEDSDFFRVRVRGEFPRTGARQLISPELVTDSRREFRRRFGTDQVKKAIQQRGQMLRDLALDDDGDMPRLLSVDAARSKTGDESVIGLRQGRTFIVLQTFRGLDGPQLAYRVAEWIKEVEPDATFVDAVGIGVSCFDTLIDIGYEAIAVNGSISPMDERKYLNRRTEMWFLMNEWLKSGGRIDYDDDVLGDELSTPEYGYTTRGERYQLETKDDLRARNEKSPDRADCLSMTFFMPVAPRPRRQLAERLAQRARGLHGGKALAGATSWMSY